ncbi:MAG: oligosaccharide flippase family protein, partial [Lachnospiraceae bacterium]|nr:oligosaccharide flippase family protein [Lachnospiraceae bacterium]
MNTKPGMKHYLIRGTLLLTLMGALTRTAGFFYKIFLSRTIGASEIGLYQIAMPVFSFCTALCGGGVQTTISRFVAEYRAKEENRSAKKILVAGLLLSVSLSFLCAVSLYLSAPLVAQRFLLEKNAAPLLKIMAFSLPFCMIHGCICGYFMGEKQVVPPALSQLVEQMLRITFVILVYVLLTRQGQQPDARIMAFGQLAGEAAAAIYCAICMYAFSGKKTMQTILCRSRIQSSQKSILHFARQLLPVSFPLGLNRMLMCVLQAIEAALLPQMLQRSGLASVEALSVYGPFTGMALPVIYFPTAVTSAFGMLLLPTVSEANALHRRKRLGDTVTASFMGSLLLGSFFLGAFLLAGEALGNMVFHSRLAGIYIRYLAFCCPLIYINTTMI